MKIIDIKQNSKEWETWRSNKIGASDCPIIMGESSYSTKAKLWKQKLGLEPSSYISTAMQHGAKTEFEARDVFEGKMGKNFNSVCGESSTIEYMTASFDGMSKDGEIVEIKCPHSADRYFEMKVKNEVPIEYYGQLQHQMYVAETEYVYLFIYFAGDHILHKVLRDEAYIDKMLIEEERFWFCLQNGEMPEISKGDFFENVSEDWKLKAIQLSQILAQKRKLEEMEKELKKELISLSNGVPTKAYGITVYQQTRKGNLDTSRLENDLKDQGFDIESYRKMPTSSWCVIVR